MIEKSSALPVWDELEEERARVAADWEKRKLEIEGLPLPKNIGELVDVAADRFGENPAWNFFETGQVLTFNEVASLSRKAASALLTAGARPGTRIAVMVGNGPNYLGTWLGAARIGATIVPVNGRYTSRELEHVISKSGSKLLIVDAANLAVYEQLPETNRPIGRHDVFVCGDLPGYRNWLQLVEESSGVPVVSDADADDVMSIQFTSGTTGFPKGCMLPQRFWLNAAVGVSNSNDLEIERFLCNQMLFYLDGQYNAIICLYRGTTFFCCSKPSAAKFLDWIKEYRINEVFMFDALYKKAEPSPNDRENELKLVHIFGFNPKLHQELEARFGAPARESFGMSEYAPALIMPLAADCMIGSASCGLAAPNTRLRIVDDFDEDVASGDVGELLIQSPGLMTGYAGDEEASHGALKGGWLHTGDLFRRDQHGYHYLVGRKKDMVRRNAENVACVEVESVLRMHPAVAEAAVVAVPDDVVGEEIKAYVLATAGAPPEPEELLAFCGQHLAKFKIPRYIQFVDSFSITESSRVEKKKLVSGVTDLRAGSYDATMRRWL
ncbi:AMP-binding protein [Rhizobium sp. ICMP 5592]|uniref:class I adenylate-forming enzyme family protein n=1 Tax=Rhizobium sp. ICMP 5592 TaxID=2292445 RepID=UPI001297E69D|nr:AMP-binding protein [Rhizobium sp. ICMP 5592]MQB46114.1 AMP-binding protein [Rhizobium sp. ICMP 5592]